MRVALITGLRRVEMVEVPEPEPAEGGVVVDVAACGVCGTDLHAFRSGDPYNPAVCGHEWAGTLSAVGAGVTGLREGDRVVVGVPPACGRCGACRAGQPVMCEQVHQVAVGRDERAPRHGGFAPRIAVDAGRVVVADPTLSDIQAAQVEPLTVSLHAVRRSLVHLGDTIVVQGGGSIGLLTLQVARAAGAGNVIVVEPDDSRRALALSLGADRAVTPEEAADAVAEASGGRGADVVYECVGRPESIQTAVDRARRGGSVCIIGLAHGDALISPRSWLIKEITVTAVLAYCHEEFAMAMGLLADGRVCVEPIHTGTVGLGGLQAAMEDITGGHSRQVKVLVDPRLAG